jgi:pimeloyl-ACP methyl ester carboxylesterase
VVSYGDVRLTVLDQGSGPAVVMIPSLGRGAADFDDLTGRLVAAGYRVLRPEPRGIDGSTGPMTGLSLHDLADDVAHVITASGLKHAVVLGHDDGNRTARATAAYYPGLVSAVILVGAGGKAPPDPAAAAALRATFDDKLSPEQHLSAVSVGFFAPGNDPALWRNGWHSDTAQMERSAGAATPLSDWWTAGSAPILVVQGDQDRIAPPENAMILKADVGGRATVVHIANAGHALLPEQPGALADAVIDYLHRSTFK